MTPVASTGDGGSTHAVRALLATPRFWVAPIAAVVGIMCLLAAMYMGAIVNPERHLHDFSVDLVVEDTGASQGADAPRAQFGNEVAQGIVDGTKGTGLSLRTTDRGTALDRLASAQTYGVIIIPADFSQSAIDLAGSVVGRDTPSPPTIDVLTNRRSGTFASSILTTAVDRIKASVNERFGAQLTQTVRDRLAQNDIPFVGLASYAFAAPVVFDVSDAQPLPGGAANGLSAFYFTILLVLAGFTGALIVHSLVDGMLGVIPIEFGPRYRLRRRLPISRRGTLVVKWWIMFLIAMVQSALYIAVCAAVGMDNPAPFTLWMYSTLVITAVGVTASSIMALFGTPGMIVNLVFFVILGLPSSGGAVPLEASPRIFTWLAEVEPMRQIYLGVRSILYFDGDFSAGLGHSLVTTLIGLLIGLLMGSIAVRLYDAKGWQRAPGSELDEPETSDPVSVTTEASPTVRE
ncbi:YhgE/Pip domain-containing protein [Williamsia sp. M5A3_1d]